MKKILMLFGVLMLVVTFLSGCNELNERIDDLVNNLAIESFQATPEIIDEGETSTLSWVVTGATTVEIDNGIGNVSLTGSRIVAPTETNIYTLTASNSNTTVTATVQVIVINDTATVQDSPNLAWTTNDADDTITITSGSTSHKYADTSTDGNLVFKKGTTYYYLKTDLSLTTSESDLSTAPILAGDVITGFTSGDYQIIWIPTNKLLGEVTFAVQSAPNLAWAINTNQNIMTITSGSTTHTYADSSTDGNLIFRLDGTDYYIKTDLSIGSTETELSTNNILAGDVITGFTAGTYQVVWVPTNKLLGEITFTGQSAPNLAWTIDDSDDTLTITSGSATSHYASDSTTANLVFKLSGTKYYVQASMHVDTGATALSTATISAGDVLTFNTTGTYQIVWEPTDKLLGSVTFT